MIDQLQQTLEQTETKGKLFILSFLWISFNFVHVFIVP